MSEMVFVSDLVGCLEIVVEQGDVEMVVVEQVGMSGLGLLDEDSSLEMIGSEEQVEELGVSVHVEDLAAHQVSESHPTVHQAALSLVHELHILHHPNTLHTKLLLLFLVLVLPQIHVAHVCVRVEVPAQVTPLLTMSDHHHLSSANVLLT